MHGNPTNILDIGGSSLTCILLCCRFQDHLFASYICGYDLHGT